MTEPIGNTEWTREQVLVMEPGPEMDALVAEKLFGKTVDLTRASERVVWNEGGLWSFLRDYSTDISAAWEVLKQTKMIVHIEGHIHTGWSVTLDGKFTAIEWELPVAICKAALLAVMGL